MKNYFGFLLFTTIIFSSCNQKSSVLQTTINGVIDDTSISRLFIRDPNGFSDCIDTIMVVDGQFLYNFKTEVPEVRFILDEVGKIEIELVSEPGGIDINWNNGYYTISNTLSNNLRSYRKESEEIMKNGDGNFEEEMKSLIKEMVAENEDNGISILAMLYGPNFIPGNDVFFDSLYLELNQEVLYKTSIASSVIEAKEMRRAARELAENLPTFEVIDENSSVFNLTDLKGKYVFIDLWASWCAPCIQEIPALKEVYKEYKDDITFVSLSTDSDTDKWKRALEKGIGKGKYGMASVQCKK